MYSLNSGPESTDLQDIPLDWPMYSLNSGLESESTDLQDIPLDWPVYSLNSDLNPLICRISHSTGLCEHAYVNYVQ